jgi:hypothetical protein
MPSKAQQGQQNGRRSFPRSTHVVADSSGSETNAQAHSHFDYLFARDKTVRRGGAPGELADHRAYLSGLEPVHLS